MRRKLERIFIVMASERNERGHPIYGNFLALLRTHNDLVVIHININLKLLSNYVLYSDKA